MLVYLRIYVNVNFGRVLTKESQHERVQLSYTYFYHCVINCFINS